MEWHLKTTKAISEYETLRDTNAYITRASLFKSLRARYNIKDEYYGQVKRITLPSSKATVNIVWNDAGAMLRSILTDPRVSKKDYLFFDDDPFAPPPLNLDYIQDINTGESYRETYARRITNPQKQILMPTPLYIDGFVSGQFMNLPITQLKMTAGILNQKAWDKPYLWRNLGFVPAVAKNRSRSRRLMLQSGHCDKLMAHQDVLEEEGERPENSVINKLEDYHAMLDAILDSYVKMQDEGCILDFNYNGKTYKDIEIITFIPYIKVDNEEADKLCAKFGSRSGGVAHICRYCAVPTHFSGRAAANYPMKTQPQIAALVAAEDLDALQAMSQHSFRNCFYCCNFGLHNLAGVHGACTTDMLHTILLGIFMRVRDGFFQQIGPTSETAREIDALAREYGELMARHSERDMPKTKFSKGITGGKLMAKEYEGVLLLIAIVLRSSKGIRLLRSAKSGNFAHPDAVEDWVLLVESLLGWLQWLKSEQMQTVHVDASEWKHRYLMFLIKKCVRRTKGMGMKFLKFHLMTHITSDIRNGGVPRGGNTGANEKGHKDTKTQAMLTQKKEETFNSQTAARSLEMHLIALAMEEINGRPLWKYLEGYTHPVECAPTVASPHTGGGTFQCKFNGVDEDNTFVSLSKQWYENGLFVETAFVDFVAGLQIAVHALVGDVAVRTEHKRNGQMFRAHIKYRGKVWRDWVEVDWDDWGLIPNKIWGLVDLRALGDNGSISYGGLVDLKPGVYAIVESAAYLSNNTGEKISQIFTPIRKEVGKIVAGAVTELKFYLADVEAFVAPLVVIANIGGQPNDYFVVKNRAEWKEDFEDWLETPNEDNTFTMSDDETDDDSYDDRSETDLNVKKAAKDLQKEDKKEFEKWELVSGDEETDVPEIKRKRRH